MVTWAMVLFRAALVHTTDPLQFSVATAAGGALEDRPWPCGPMQRESELKPGGYFPGSEGRAQ